MHSTRENRGVVNDEYHHFSLGFELVAVENLWLIESFEGLLFIMGFCHKVCYSTCSRCVVSAWLWIVLTIISYIDVAEASWTTWSMKLITGTKLGDTESPLK